MKILYFQTRCWMDGVDEPQIVKTTRGNLTPNADATVAFLTEVVGHDDGKIVTRHHWRDPDTGEYTSVVRAEKVRDEPFVVNDGDMKSISAIADNKPPKSETAEV